MRDVRFAKGLLRAEDRPPHNPAPVLNSPIGSAKESHTVLRTLVDSKDFGRRPYPLCIQVERMH